LARKRKAENRDVPADYTKVARRKMEAEMEKGARGIEFMTMESIARGARGTRPEEGELKPSKAKRTWKSFKIASKHVMVRLPGSFMSRKGKSGAYVGGLESNPRRLAATVMNWNKHNISVKALAQSTAFEIEMAQTGVYVQAERHKGNTVSKRKSLPGNEQKRLDAIGSVCASTLTDAIHAFQMTVNIEASEQILTADGIQMGLDISTFGTDHMQSLYLCAWWVEPHGVDAAGSPLWRVRMIDGFGPAVAVGDKLSRQLLDQNGKLLSTATARGAAYSVCLANLLGVLKHPFLSIGVDGGSEGSGMDDPNSKENSRANKKGLGGYRYELVVKRRAF
jgi:hypothetical protein